MSQGFSNAILPDCPPGESVGLAADPFVNCSGGSSTTLWSGPCPHCGTIFERHVHPGGSAPRFCSSSCAGYANGHLCASGEKHWNWKGGVTPESRRIRQSAEYKKWRKDIFTRDNWICRDCGDRGGELHAHHIFEFAKYEERRFDVANGITLCRSCHEFIHAKVA